MSDKALDGGELPFVAPTPIDIAVRLRKTQLSPAFVTGVVLLMIVVLAAIFAPLLTPYDPIEQRFTDAFLPPLSPGHVLGTDNFGRDIWSRIVYSARLDLQIGLISVLFPFLFGSLMGIATGYLGGSLDTLVMRVVDVLMAFPFLILVIAIMSILGPGLTNLYIAVGVVGWIPYTRITRGETLATRHLEYIEAARTVGCTSARVMLRHVLPNVIAPALIYVFTAMVLAILTREQFERRSDHWSDRRVRDACASLLTRRARRHVRARRARGEGSGHGRRDALPCAAPRRRRLRGLGAERPKRARHQIGRGRRADHGLLREFRRGLP